VNSLSFTFMSSKQRNYPKQIRIPTTQSVLNLAKLFEKNSSKSKSAPNTPIPARKVNFPAFSLPNSPEKVTTPELSVMNRLSKAATVVSEAVGDIFGAASTVRSTSSIDWSTDIADEVLLDSFSSNKMVKADQKRKASKSPSLEKSMGEDSSAMQAQIDSHSLLLEEFKQNLLKLTADTTKELNQMANNLTRHDAEFGERLMNLETRADEHAARLVVLEDFKDKMTTEARAFFEKQMADLKKNVLDASKANLYNMAISNAEQGIYVTGINNIKRLLQLTGNWDPAMVIGELLLQCDRQIYGSKDRIIIPVAKGKTRQETNVGIIYFRSIQCKKEAAIMMKKLLGQRKAKGIGLRDLFPQEKMEEVNQLNKIGNYLRMEKVITKYKVINIGNAPVIQVIYEDGRFYTTMEQDRIDDILKIMPQDEEMEQDNQQQTSRQDDQRNNDTEQQQEQQQQRPFVPYSGGGAKAKRPNGDKDETNISGEETGGRGGGSGSRTEDGAVGGAAGGARGGGGGSRGGSSSGRNSRNASSSRGRSGSGASAGKVPAKSNSDSDKASYAQKAGTRGGLANRTKKPADSNTMLKFITTRLPGALGKN